MLEIYSKWSQSGVAIEDGLTSVASVGTLELLGGRGWTSVHSITNDGTIDLAGGVFQATALINDNTGVIAGYGSITAPLTNKGILSAAAGKTLSLEGGALSTLSGGVLSGGIYSAGAGGTLRITGSGSITTLDATVELLGAGATLQNYNTATSSLVSLESSLISIGATGKLKLVGARGWASSRRVANAGTIDLEGGAFKAAALANDLTGTITGNGSIAAPLTNDGAIDVAGGALSVTALTNSSTGKVEGYGSIAASINNKGLLSAAAGKTLSLQAGALLNYSGGTLSDGKCTPPARRGNLATGRQQCGYNFKRHHRSGRRRRVNTQLQHRNLHPDQP